MDKGKRNNLEHAGWRVGDATSFLQLDEAEATYVALKSELGQALRSRRQALHLSQDTLARRLGSSQSRLAKMETADASVSLDLLVRTLLRLGLSRGSLARLLRAA